MTADELEQAVNAAFDFLKRHDGDAWAVDEKLRQLAADQTMHCMELAIWLRMTSSMSSELSAWQPLLNRTVEVCRSQNLPPEDVLYGLIPNTPHPTRNTGYPT